MNSDDTDEIPDDTASKRPIRDTILTIARANTNPKQRGARRVEFVRGLDRYRNVTSQNVQDEIDTAVETLVETGRLEREEHDGTVYYRLAEGD